jgi:3-hydroxy-9,10-secoandrosta-1,3,5(10)-triene-9,17-dione monooxygenase
MGVILDRPGVTDADRKQRAELVARAAELVPLLARNARRTEDERRVAEENIAALTDAGLLRITQPKRYGGWEVDFRTKLEIVRELARGCGSTAWVASLLTGGAWYLGLWNEQVQADVWGADPDARVAGVVAPGGTAELVDGGYRVSGRWAYCSGSLHAQWLFLGVPILGSGSGTDSAPVDFGSVLLPAADITIEDTWFVTGMRGSGSNTVVARDVFVPRHRFVSAPRLLSGQTDTPFRDEATYRAPFAASVPTDLVGPQLGLARAALDLVLARAPTRGIAHTEYASQTEAPTVQVAVARAASLIEIAELLAYRAAADVDEAGWRGELPEHRERARIRMAVAQAIVHARDAIRELVSVHGAASFAESNPLQRIWRDSEVASRHAVANPDISAQLYGRALLGLAEGPHSTL